MRHHIEDLVAVFNEQICNFKPGQKVSESLIELRVKQMHEEVNEIREALEQGDAVKAADGLLDLTYFAVGTLHLMGVHRERFNAGFQAVHLANMSKRGGIKEERRIPGISDEEHPMDAIKPEGWIDPEFILEMIFSAQ